MLQTVFEYVLRFPNGKQFFAMLFLVKLAGSNRELSPPGCLTHSWQRGLFTMATEPRAGRAAEDYKYASL
jgi:hypothetical protein